jgi:hypothetical protein
VDHGNENDAVGGSHWPIRGRSRLLESAADAERRLFRQRLDAVAERRSAFAERKLVVQLVVEF